MEKFKHSDHDQLKTFVGPCLTFKRAQEIFDSIQAMKQTFDEKSTVSIESILFQEVRNLNTNMSMSF